VTPIAEPTVQLLELARTVTQSFAVWRIGDDHSVLGIATALGHEIADSIWGEGGEIALRRDHVGSTARCLEIG